jgi:hypothetical protein
MAFPRDIIVAGINIADALTAGVQGTVQYQAYTSANGDGDESYAAAVPLQCVIDMKRRSEVTPSGRIVTTVAKLTFPRGGLNINPKDRITLPDGTTGPLILDAPDAVFDPVTGRGFITSVGIGEVASQSGI